MDDMQHIIWIEVCMPFALQDLYLEGWQQGCMSRTSVGHPAIETPPPQAEILQSNPPPSGRKKIPFYLVLKGSKIFFGAFGAEKHP